MHNFSFLLIGMALLSGPAAAADKLGKRTAAPERSMAGIGEGLSDAELERQVAQASVHPLGSLGNPIRVGGPEGERAYVARLRCGDGKPPGAGESRPGGVGPYGTFVELVPLDCGAAAPGRVDLLMDMYHEEHVETRAPAGFTLAPR